MDGSHNGFPAVLPGSAPSGSVTPRPEPFCDAGGAGKRWGGRSPRRARPPDRHRLTLVSGAISMPNRLDEQSVIPPGRPPV